MGAMELADESIIELAAAKSIQHMMLDYDNRLQRYTGQSLTAGVTFRTVLNKLVDNMGFSRTRYWNTKCATRKE